MIFGKVAKIPTDGLPPVLFYLAGLLGWSYFAQTFQSTSGTLVANAGLFGKVYFPRLVVPLSAVISNLLAFALQLGTFLCFWIYFKFFTAAGASFGFSGAIVCLPLVVLQIAALSLGVGLWLSALTAKYRDFTLFERLHHPDLDVCHARDLSSIADPGEMAVARSPQSHDHAGRDHKIYVARTGRRRSVLLRRSRLP